MSFFFVVTIFCKGRLILTVDFGWFVAFESISIFCVKIHRNCNFVGLLHHPLWLQLVLALLGDLFSTFETTFWLRITDEGSVPEMRIWSILLILFDQKWCIHLSRSLCLYWYKNAIRPSLYLNQTYLTTSRSCYSMPNIQWLK